MIQLRKMPPSATNLLDVLASYAPGPDDAGSLAEIRSFVGASSAPFSRASLPGHVTASAVVARSDAAAFLLVWHRKLARWLQPGGHVEPDDDSVFAAALREAREETGLSDFGYPIGDRILDVDVHPIPAHKTDPPHLHYDIRYLVTADAPPTLPLPETKWFTLEDALTADTDDSLTRAVRKAAVHLTAVPTTCHRPPTT